MSADFRTRQLRVSQIVNSGSTSTTPLLIYGLESATNDSGGFDASHFVTGSDTWLFISGISGAKNSTSRGVVTFKGDVVISGTIYNSGGVAYSTSGGSGTPGGSNSQIQFNSGSTFSGSQYFTFNYTSGSLQNGFAVVASGLYSHAQGYESTSSALSSHAEGLGTRATATGAHSEGHFTLASGYAAHTEGYNTTGSGDYSHAEGNATIAVGTYSRTAGIATIASGSGQVAYGSYNKRNNASSLFIIGNGTADADATRSDILRVETANVQITGSLIVSSGNITGSNLQLSGDLEVNGGDLTTTSTGTATLFNTNATTVNIAGGATSGTTVGNATGGVTLQGSATVAGSLQVNGNAIKASGGATALTLTNGNLTGSNLQLTGDLAVNGGDITTSASTFNIASSATTLNLGSSAGKVVIPGDFEVQGTTVTVDVTNITIEDPLISLGFTTGSVAGSAGDRGFIGGITGAGNNVAFAWSNNSGSFVATKTTSTPGATSVVVGALQPIRASSFQVNGTTAVVTSSNGTTLTLSGTAVVADASTAGKVIFKENGTNYIEFATSGGTSAQIRGIESLYPSLYLSGAQVHVDSYDGNTWLDKNSDGFLLVDSTTASSPKIYSRRGDGLAYDLTLSGADLFLGSNNGRISSYRGTTEYLRSSYNGSSDVVFSAQAFNFSVGSAGTMQVSGSTVTLNHGAGSVTLQRHGSTFLTISSGSGDLSSIVASTGKQFQVGGTGLTKLSGSLLALSAGPTGIGFEVSNTNFLTVLAQSANTVLSASNQLILRPTSGITQVTGTLAITSNVTASNLRLSGDIQLEGGDIQSTAGGVSLFTDTGYVTTVNIGGFSNRNMNLMSEADVSSVTFSLARYRAGKVDVYLATGPTDAEIKNIDIGTGALASGVTYINLGSATANSYGRTLINTTLTDLKGLLTVTGSSGFGVSSSNQHSFKGSVIVSGSITGSLTKLFDGTDYLRAGSNVTLTTGSDGSVTIASTGGSGSPAGSNTQVQFNADGAFAATSGLTFATGSSSLTITGDLAVDGGDITTTSSTATIFSTNVSSLSLASAASSVSVGGSSSSTSFTLNVAASRTGASTLNLATGATSTGNTKNVNIGQGGDPGSTTNVRIGTTDTNATTNIYMSGSVYVTGSVGMKGSIVPDATATYTLGTDTLRWAHVYTGDLHLRNERGDWTIIEEPDFLRIVNNKTGKSFKMLMQSLD